MGEHEWRCWPHIVPQRQQGALAVGLAPLSKTAGVDSSPQEATDEEEKRLLL